MFASDLSAAPPPSEELNLPESPRPKKRGLSIAKKAFLVVFFVLFFTFGWFGYKVYATWHAIGQKNLSGGAPALAGAVNPNQLRGEGDGRVNILVVGRDSAAGLTDTIIVASIDPETGHTAMLSIPRDLYVQVHGSNRLDKINAVYDDGEKMHVSGGGAQLLKDTVADIIDVPIHYFAAVDFAGFRQIISTVGGVEVTVDKPIYDPFYPKEDYSGTEPFSISAGPHHLDGNTALKYVRTRKGVNSGNDFGRARRQQQVLEAVGTKVKSSDTLLNPAKVDQILNALGAHFRTDLQLWEIKKLIEIGKLTDSTKITSIVLTDEAGQPGNLLTSGTSAGGAFILKPKSGNFEQIKEYVHSIFVDPYIKKEAAKIELQNGSIRTGLSAQVGKLLTNYNYNIVKTGDASRHDYQDSVITVYGDKTKNPYTLRLLELRLGVSADKVVYESGAAESGADIVVILGNNYGKS